MLSLIIPSLENLTGPGLTNCTGLTKYSILYPVTDNALEESCVSTILFSQVISNVDLS